MTDEERARLDIDTIAGAVLSFVQERTDDTALAAAACGTAAMMLLAVNDHVDDAGRRLFLDSLATELSVLRAGYQSEREQTRH